MSKTGLVFDADVAQLVHLLLRAHAKANAGFRRYDNIGEQISFEVANRGLRIMGYNVVVSTPMETETKK